MKHNFLSNLIAVACPLALALAGSTAIAQQIQQGALRFVNASALTGKAVLTIDAAKLRPDGFGPGENTGMIGILAGAHRFNITHPTAGKADTNVLVQPNTFMTVIAFSKPALDPQTKKTIEIIQLFARADPPREKGKHFQVISVSSHPSVDLTINGQPLTLASFRELKADDAAKGALKIEFAGKSVLNFAADESGSFLAVLYDRPDGTMGAVLLPDYG